MAEKKELMDDGLLDLVSGGYLKSGWSDYLDQWMAKYQGEYTKERFLEMFDIYWKRAKEGKQTMGGNIRHMISPDTTDADYEACRRYIEENYKYTPDPWNLYPTE